ncbi:MAG: hypothetical protein RMK84_14300 [Oscillochloridaceae bacterium]|nr:hypothetical protein [Chloroflexaceae bacterium]MDW8391293.1 hypothetical protein [Oscillochloridaceae bacterium]
MITVLTWVGWALLILFILFAIAIPTSVLIWWAGWRKATPQTRLHPPGPPVAGPFLVYLSGVDDISGEFSTPYEDALLDAIADRIPGLVIVTDVFAYSFANVGITSEGNLAWFWAWLNALRLNKKSPLRRVGRLINLRNMLHVAVSADRRYGPMYNYGVAEMIIQGLLRHGYVLGSGSQVALLGYSGGAQIALGTSGYIQATLRAPVQVISLGGIMNSDESLSRINVLIHLYGTRDRWHRLSDVIFPARWPIFRGSQWNRALAMGKIEKVCLGPMFHTGRGSYLDATRHVEDGRSYLDVTADTIAERIRRLTPRAAAASLGA